LARHNFRKKKGLAMAKNKNTNIVFYDRYLLTVEEAAVYFHIGSKKMRNMIKNHEGAKWILYNGNRIMIKREQFGKWLDNQSVI
jgi:excisionase family DNA binding protein